MFQWKEKGENKATVAGKSRPKPKSTYRRKVVFAGDCKTTMVFNLRFGEKTNESLSSFMDGINVELGSPRRVLTEKDGFFVTNESKDRGKRKEKWPPAELKDSFIDLNCWEALLYEDFDGQRDQAYKDAHLIVLCAAVNDRESLDSLKERWLPELVHHLPEIPMILIGFESDLRSRLDSQIAEPGFTIDEGKAMARQFGALAYTEYNANMYVYMDDMAEFLIYYAFETCTLPKSGWFSWLFG